MILREHMGHVVVFGMVALLCILMAASLVALPGCGSSGGDEIAGAGVDSADVDLGWGNDAGQKDAAPIAVEAVTEKAATTLPSDGVSLQGSLAPGAIAQYKFHTRKGRVYVIVLTSRQGDGSMDGGDDADLYISRTAKIDPNDPATYWRKRSHSGMKLDGILFKSNKVAPMYITVLGANAAVGTEVDYNLIVGPGGWARGDVRGWQGWTK